LKVAFDENIPIALVRVFQTFAKERQFQYLSKGLTITIESAKDYTPKPDEHDFDGNNDVPWIERFAASGGKVIISANTEMRNVAHERLALIETGMIVIFFERSWSNWHFFRKCSLLLNWWPKVADKVKRAKKGSFWCIPSNWNEDGQLRKLSNRDSKKLKMERQLSKKPKTPAKQEAAKKSTEVRSKPQNDERQVSFAFDDPENKKQ
jgi:PIN like domain